MLFRGFGPYAHLRGYLHRWRIFQAGRWMLRVHRILTPDATPFLHSHPFDYVSLVIWGGYEERVLQEDGSLRVVRRRPFSVVFRRAQALHRIDHVPRGGCLTLFLARTRAQADAQAQGWRLQRHPAVVAPATYWNAPDGLYGLHGGWRKREKGAWYALRGTPQEAMACGRLSLHQAIPRPEKRREKGLSQSKSRP